MDALYLDYLSLLTDLTRQLEQLTDLAHQKTAAVRQDDLAALDQVLSQEQALSLALRGKEQKRQKLLGQLGLSHLTLAALPGAYPSDLQPQARDTAEALRRQYDIYRSAAEVARNTLECNLHEIEKALADAGGPVSGPGYGPSDAEPPAALKTDLRV